MRRRLLLLPLAAAMALAVGIPAASARPRAVARHHDPVLLVHGFNGSGAGWHTMAAYLRTQGYHADEIDAMSYDSGASNVDTARRIAEEAAALRARTGADRIDVVSHSMGAISSRYYLERLGGAAHVDAWVSLAGVNEGTVWAYGCYPLTPCREMVPSSSILQRLEVAFHPAGPTRYRRVVVAVRRGHRAPRQRRALGCAERRDRLPRSLGAQARPHRARTGTSFPRRAPGPQLTGAGGDPASWRKW